MKLIIAIIKPPRSEATRLGVLDNEPARVEQ